MHSTLVDIWTNIETEGILYVAGYSFVFEFVCVKGTDCAVEREREVQEYFSFDLFVSLLFVSFLARSTLINQCHCTPSSHKSRQQLTGPNIYMHALEGERGGYRGDGVIT